MNYRPEHSSSSSASHSPWGHGALNRHELKFLEGPQSRTFELLRALRIFLEFIKGFRALHFVGPCVTVFGSARFQEDNRYYQWGREIGQGLGRAGFSVMTGGGPGIMEAANRGAKEVGAYSLGCNIILPKEQQPNPYLDRWIEFNYFFVRKVMLVKYSYAFVVLPGGFGTLDEVFETATLIQTGKISNFPLVLVGRDYWGPLLEFFRTRLLAEGTIAAEDIDRLIITDDPQEAVQLVQQGLDQLALSKAHQPGTRSFLGRLLGEG